MSDGYGSVTTQVFPTNSPGYESSLNSYYSFDPAKAKQLLAEAGYPHGFTLDMPSITAAFGEATYALIQAELANIGIKVNYTDYQGSHDIYRDPRPEVSGHLLHPGRRPRPLAAGPVPADQGRHVQSLPFHEFHGRRLSQHDADGFKLPGGGRGQGT